MYKQCGKNAANIDQLTILSSWATNTPIYNIQESLKNEGRRSYFIVKLLGLALALSALGSWQYNLMGHHHHHQHLTFNHEEVYFLPTYLLLTYYDLTFKLLKTPTYPLQTYYNLLLTYYWPTTDLLLTYWLSLSWSLTLLYHRSSYFYYWRLIQCFACIAMHYY